MDEPSIYISDYSKGHQLSILAFCSWCSGYLSGTRPKLVAVASPWHSRTADVLFQAELTVRKIDATVHGEIINGVWKDYDRICTLAKDGTTDVSRLLSITTLGSARNSRRTPWRMTIVRGTRVVRGRWAILAESQNEDHVVAVSSPYVQDLNRTSFFPSRCESGSSILVPPMPHGFKTKVK